LGCTVAKLKRVLATILDGSNLSVFTSKRKLSRLRPGLVLDLVKNIVVKLIETVKDSLRLRVFVYVRMPPLCHIPE
jgi:hypothetical protein